MSQLSDFFFEQAAKALNTVGMVPPAAPSPPCATAEAQDEPAGSPSIDWALDTRPTYKLSDAEAIDKMHWQLRALNSHEQLQREFERRLPTVYPEVK